MGDGPKDDKTEAMREVPSKAPDDGAPVENAPAENAPAERAPAERAPGERAPGGKASVDGATEVLRQVPPRDTPVDETTKVLRQVPARGDRPDGPGEAVTASSADDGVDSPTQVVRAVGPKATTPPAKAEPGPNVDGLPTTVMRSVPGKPAADAKPVGPADDAEATTDEADAAGGEADAAGDKADAVGDKADAVGDKADAVGDKADAVGDAAPGAEGDKSVSPDAAKPPADREKPGTDVDSPTAVMGSVAAKPAAAVSGAEPEAATEAATESVSEGASKSASESATEAVPGTESKVAADASTVAVPAVRTSGSAVEQTQGPEPAPPAPTRADKPDDDAPKAGPHSEADSEADSDAEPEGDAGSGKKAAAVAAAGAVAAAATAKAEAPDKQTTDAQAEVEQEKPAEAKAPEEAPVPAATSVPATSGPIAEAPTAEAPARATPVRIEPTPGRWPVSEPPRGGGKKRRLVLVGAALVVLLGLGGWVLTLAHGSLKDVPEVIAPSPPKVTLAYQPGDGTTPVSPTTPISVTATDGELREVSLTAAGAPIKGELSPDRRTWTVSQPLAYGKTYTWAGTAADASNKTVPLAGTVTTVKPRKTTRGTINIGDGRVVGIAAPIELQFNGHVTDRAAAERALKVDTSVPTVGSWAWFQDEGGGSRIRWRPQAYWQPGTKVTVTAPMFGVDYGGGSWGAANVSTSFTIGRSQITKADVNSHQLVVLRDGQQVFKFPASYGLGSDPDRNTRNGVHVVSEKFTDKRMVNPQYGYDVMEKFAVRISNNGEFIHANPLTVGVQGSRNITHGCVNLSLNNAKQYFDSAMYGDPVEVTGSPIPLSAKDGDIWDWTLGWDQWTRLSALNGS